MFEDSTFESAGRIHARSRRWMIAAFIFNAAILLALILIPLICPEALPHQAIAFLMEAPEPPLAAKPPREEPVRATQTATEMQGGQIFAPRRIPPGILIPAAPSRRSILTPKTGPRTRRRRAATCLADAQVGLSSIWT
jgi:protein TonB